MTTPNESPVSFAALEQRILELFAQGDVTQLAQLIRDDFLEFTSRGVQYEKAAILATLTKPQPSAPPYSVRDVRVNMLAAHIALVTYTMSRPDANGTETHSRRGSVWVLTSNRWELVFHQGTPVVE